MNPEETSNKIQTKKFFKSSKSRFGFGPGKLRYGNIRSMSGIIPNRTIPQNIAEKISQVPSEQESGSGIEPTKTVINSLGRLTLDLVQIGDNLDKIKEVIEEDYKQTKEKNKKEVEDYRKRIANRGKKISKKDLGNDKKSLSDVIKPFISGFFSGAGGAIRGLASFNLIEALMNGDYMKVFQSLMGIGITFIPQIGAMIAGTILKSLLKGFGRNMFGGGMRGGGGVGRMGGGGRVRSPGIGKFGSMLALGTGALALGGAYAASQDGQGTDGSEDQTRLEDLTAEQKALTDKGLISITQDDLKKFEDLNKKFDKTLDLLMGGKSRRGNGGSGGQQSDSETENSDISLQGVTPMGPATTDQQQAYKTVYDAAVKAGSPDPDMSASIAMLESGWLNPNLTSSRYNQSGGTNPFGQTGTGTKGSVNGFAVYNSLEEGVANHVKLWAKYYGATPEETVKKMRDAGYNQEGGGGPWMRKVLSIYNGRKTQPTPPSPTPAAQPAPKPTRPAAANPSSPTGRPVAVLPIPITGTGGIGAGNNNGSGDVASVNPSNMSDVYGQLYRTGWNVVG